MPAPEGNQFWKQRVSHGRDLLFSSPDILWDGCKEYFEATDRRKWFKTDYRGKDAVQVDIPTDTPYTITGLCLFLDIGVKTWRLYRDREDFIPVVTRVEQIIYTQKFEGAAVGAFNPSIIARDLGLDKEEKEEGDKETQELTINVKYQNNKEE